MGVNNRKTLKNFFAKGNVPDQKHFESLIDSCVNRQEDGISFDDENGLKLFPAGKKSKVVMSFCQEYAAHDPNFQLSLGTKDSDRGLIFRNSREEPIMYFDESGAVGVGETNPRHRLHVKGRVAMQERIGTFKGVVSANGMWQVVIGNLTGISAFEVMAYASAKEKYGKYAIAHAIAVKAHAHSKGTVRMTQSISSGGWRNKLKMKWAAGKNGKYELLIKTKSDYGQKEEGYSTITFYVTKLWNHNLVS